jgi:hypothetical protein
LAAAEIIQAEASDRESRGGSGIADVGEPWRRALAVGGKQVLASNRAGGVRCKLTPAQVGELGLQTYWATSAPLPLAGWRAIPGTVSWTSARPYRYVHPAGSTPGDRA